MKIKQITILLGIYIAEYLLTIPQIGSSFAHIRPGGFSLLGVVRFAGLPVLSFLLFEKLKSQRIAKVGNRYWLEMILPIVAFLILLIAQVFLIPRSGLSGHLSGSPDYVFRNLLYLCIILNINAKNAGKVIKVISVLFAITFFYNLIQYPFVIHSSGVSIASVLSSYGQQSKVKTFGLFNAANEDANAMMTLLPFALLYIDQLHGLKRKTLRIVLILLMPLALLFNGTRTALIITFPLILFLYYTDLSLKKVVRFSPLLIPIVGLAVVGASGFVSSAFTKEAEDGGSLGWRFEEVWIPAVNYTSEHSPLVGLGSLGWNYVSRAAQIGYGFGQNFDIKPAHNLYVWFFVSWGAIGLAFLLIFMFGLLRSSLQLSHLKKSNLASLSKACFCSVCAYVIWGGISNAFMGSGFNMLYGTALIVASMRVLLVEGKT